VEQVRSVFEKMNKQLGLTPKYFTNARIEIARTSTGATDVAATFLNVVERLEEIKDPAEKAATASRLLGKGWTGMAEVIAMGSDKLRKSLEEVSSAQIISNEELARAKEYRQTVDDLSDLWGDFTVEAGNAFVAVTNDFKEGTSSWEGFGNSLSRGVVATGISKITGLFNDNEEQAKATATEAKRLGDAYAGYVSSRLADSREEIIKLNNAIEDESDALETLQGEWADLIEELDVTVKLDKIGVALDELFTAGINAFGGTTEEVRKFNEANLAATTQIAELAQALDLTSREEYSIKFAVDAGDLQRAKDILTSLMAARSGGVEEMRFRGARAMGGPVSGGSSYLVGERGVEIFTPSGSGMITPNSAIGGNTITINVQGADPQAVVRALQDYNRTAGPIPVNTRGN